MSVLQAISVLGPLRVTVGGRPVALPAKQRIVLAVLALQANRLVTSDRLVEAVWGQDASPTLTKTLQSHVFQLRRALADAEGGRGGGLQILTEDRGYRLQVDPGAVDAKVFLGLLQAARADGAEPRCIISLLSEALALWSEPGIAEVGDEPTAMAEVQQLVELRLAAVEDLVRHRLALGEHEDVIPDLRRELAEAPYNERLWVSLMTALARSGRRAEALIAYRMAEDALRRELDIEPGRELQELALRIRDGSIGDVRPDVATWADAPGPAPRPAPPVPLHAGGDVTVHAC